MNNEAHYSALRQKFRICISFSQRPTMVDFYQHTESEQKDDPKADSTIDFETSVATPRFRKKPSTSEAVPMHSTPTEDSTSQQSTSGIQTTPTKQSASQQPVSVENLSMTPNTRKRKSRLVSNLVKYRGLSDNRGRPS